MTKSTAAPYPIVPREKLSFGLDGDIPPYWFAGDPFKSRFWDALSIIFPPGEKFFMTCVRDFRDQITDAALRQQIKDFNTQEAQHSIVHRQDNDRIRAQGVDVDALNAWLEGVFGQRYRQRYSRGYTLAVTAALEHFTSSLAQAMFDQRDIMGPAHPRMRALYAWHAVEEVEHKSVAYDVMIDYAKVGYFKRVLALLDATILFPTLIFSIQRRLFIHDGYGLRQRLTMIVKGSWWLLNPSGLLVPVLKAYLSYCKVGFHPWQEAHQRGHAEWLEAYERSGGDPIEASEGMRRALAM